jgi:hypothetical protein
MYRHVREKKAAVEKHSTALEQDMSFTWGQNGVVSNALILCIFLLRPRRAPSGSLLSDVKYFVTHVYFWRERSDRPEMTRHVGAFRDALDVRWYGKSTARR